MYIQKNWKTNSTIFKCNSATVSQQSHQQSPQQIVNPPYIHSLDINKRDNRSIGMFKISSVVINTFNNILPHLI